MRARAGTALVVVLLCGLAPRAEATTSNLKLVTHVPGNAKSSGDAESIPDSVSPNGRFVAFASTSTNLVTGFTDNNTTDNDIFLADRKTGAMTLVSHPPGLPTAGANGASQDPQVSANGRYVTYDSTATNLITGFTDGNGNDEDVYLFDRTTGITTLVSHAPADPTTSGNGFSNDPLISGDGSVVAFDSQAANLITGGSDTNATDDAFLYNRGTGIVTLVSHDAAATTQASDGQTFPAQLSSDGRYMSLKSKSSDLLPVFTDNNFGSPDVFLYDATTDTMTLASHAAASTTSGANGNLGHVAMSADGRTVAFSTPAFNLITGFVGNNPGNNVFAFDRTTGAVTLVSHIPGSTVSDTNGDSGGFIELSSSGAQIVFESNGTTLVPNFVDNNSPANADLYLYKRSTGKVVLVSHAVGSTASGGNLASMSPVISADGSVVAFISSATNLVNGFVNNDLSNPDTFLYTKKTGRVTLVSHIPGSPHATGNATSDVVNISDDGHSVFVGSPDDDLVTNFVANSNGDRDIFVLSR